MRAVTHAPPRVVQSSEPAHDVFREEYLPRGLVSCNTRRSYQLENAHFGWVQCDSVRVSEYVYEFVPVDGSVDDGESVCSRQRGIDWIPCKT